MRDSKPIFFDPSGKRRQIARLTLFGVITLCVASIIVGEVIFWASPLVSRKAGQITPEKKPENAVINTELSKEEIKKSRDALVRELGETRALVHPKRESASSRRRTAFVNSIDESVLTSIRAHAETITRISPILLTINSSESGASELLENSELTPLHNELLSLADELSLPIAPRLTSSGSADALWKGLEDGATRSKITEDVVSMIERGNFSELVVDVAPPQDSQHSTYESLLEALASLCHQHNKSLSTVLYLDDPVRLERLAQAVDSVVVVNLFRNSSRGALSSIVNFSDRLQAVQKRFSPDRIEVAFSARALRQFDLAKKTTEVEELSFLDAILRTQSSSIHFDPTSGTSWYKFQDEAGTRGTTWIVDAPFSYNCHQLAESGSITNFGIWNIGGEDASLWDLLTDSPSLTELAHIAPASPLSTQGRGDILSVTLSGATEGARKLHVDDQSGLITRVSYESIPTAPTTIHSGFHEKTVALTFDDGPAEPFTAQILDILKGEGIKATFFVTGEHVLEYPELVRRIYAEGHDLGNHSFSHPDLSLVSKHRVALELNSAQRALQAILGRSVLLFRPPYVSENSPLSSQEFRVLSIAQDLGYTTVGISNNGRDWVQYEEGPDGVEVERTGEDIAHEILAKVDLMSGSSILLHDGPKERERSVEAVKVLIPKLRERGFSFATIHELIGVPRDSLFPVAAQNPLRLLHRALLEVLSFGSSIFSGIFIVLVILGVIRLTFILICAILAKIRELQEPHSPEALEKARDIPVSIIIAAYNEEKVIAKTLESLLRGNHRAFEIIVVDDGSKDQTAQVVQDRFSNDQRITLIRQSNAGKSAALNYGIQFAKHDIFVCLDADTQFDPNAVTYLARHFVDPAIGGVAGNIKVGNRKSILTHWQSMEYITNISIGRRAYGYLNAIMVVAGAAGAWRRIALEQAGGYHSDSLAEDMDLTWRVRRMEWKVVNEPLAIGYTEAPENFYGLYKQRFRWSFGALQCIWKHRSALGKHGFFGWLGIPSLIVFGSLFEMLAPLADLKMLLTMFSGLSIFFSGHPIHPGSLEYDSMVSPLITAAWLYALFFGVELAISVLAFWLDGEDMRPLWLLFFQRFAYRQLMYIVACRAMWKAAIGWRQGWGTLQRTGTVSLPSS